MKIINAKNSKIIAENVKIADNFFSRTKGLLGRNSMDKGEALHIIPCDSIHSYFMKFEFDAIFINKKNQVVHLIEKMPAWHFSKICFSARSIIELPAGVIKETETCIGDLLEFTD